MRNTLKSPLIDFLDPESEAYDKSKVLKEGPFYLYGKKVFIPCRIDLFKESSFDFLSWILWAYIDINEFIRFSEHPKNQNGLLKAQLYYPILFYENTKDLVVIPDFKLHDEEYHPAVIVPEDCDNEVLLKDFYNGIADKTFHLWIGKLNS